jgi:hypothetical protein
VSELRIKIPIASIGDRMHLAGRLAPRRGLRSATGCSFGLRPFEPGSTDVERLVTWSRTSYSELGSGYPGARPRRTILPVRYVDMQRDDAVTQQEQWTPGEVRAWARQRGLGIRDRGRIPDAVIELYLAQPSTIRKWANGRGLIVSERGRLPADVVEQYLARPAAVRAWALRQGIDVGERGRLPAALVERFLDRYRQLERDAA